MNLPKVYEPEKYEADIYGMWEQGGAFKPSGEGEPYSIIMPPPNANASLHTGHMMYVVQDILIRYHRMKGNKTIYIPGADHAGFETWVVYEKRLEKTGNSRFDYTRDELYSQVWDFVVQNRGLMEVQLREMGLSADWSKLVFTLDDAVVDVTYETFQKMWKEGLIYRGERIVNYCTKHGTSFADIEVDYKDEKSHLWHIRYPLVEGSGEIVVATTRPETMLGDVAVAVHPEDERYQDLIDKHVLLPLVEKAIPVIADDMVDRAFGTGAVKITPAHDPNDFEVAERHHLPRITVIGHDGTMTSEAPLKYQEMTDVEARAAILEDLKTGEYLVSEEEYSHSVGHCYKCGTTIQPLLRDQWFVRVRPLADKAIAAIEAGEITFVPENKGKVLVNYLKNLKDWNISRQIPWGIPIPAFQSVDDPELWDFDTRVDQTEIEVDGKTFRRDPDTFDTWFSSSQWPFVTTKYHDSGELAEFFPNSVMETAGDILFPWVSRMIMMSLYREDTVPFKTVYLHGLVLDEKGQKMSKSKGNVINPQEIMGQYGSDAVRMGLIASRSAAQDQAFGTDKVIAGRNFANKLWNIARYVEGTLGDKFTEADHPQPISAADHWIVREINAAKQQIARLIEEYRFSEAYETLYHTVWDRVADWYIEASKTEQNAATMLWVLEGCLVMAHPFAPFVTEAIWQTLDWHNDDEDMLITTRWYFHEDYDAALADRFAQLQIIVKEAREIVAEIGTTEVVLTTAHSRLVLENAEIIRRLARVGYVQMVNDPEGLRLTETKEAVWLDLDEKQITTYKQKLTAKLTTAQSVVQHLEKRLSNESYVRNAPKDLVLETEQSVEQKRKQITRLERQLKNL